MFITSADGFPPRMAITVRLLHQQMGNFHGWLVPEVPMPHPEGQRSLTYCINPREGIPTLMALISGYSSYSANRLSECIRGYRHPSGVDQNQSESI